MLNLYIKARETALRFVKNESGASLAEYALLIALVLIGAAVAVIGLTDAVSGAIDTGSTCLNDPTAANCA